MVSLLRYCFYSGVARIKAIQMKMGPSGDSAQDLCYVCLLISNTKINPFILQKYGRAKKTSSISSFGITPVIPAPTSATSDHAKYVNSKTLNTLKSVCIISRTWVLLIFVSAGVRMFTYFCSSFISLPFTTNDDDDDEGDDDSDDSSNSYR